MKYNAECVKHVQMLTSQVNLCERCVVMECFSYCRTRSEVDAVDCHFTMFIVAEKSCVLDVLNEWLTIERKVCERCVRFQ